MDCQWEGYGSLTAFYQTYGIRIKLERVFRCKSSDFYQGSSWKAHTLQLLAISSQKSKQIILFFGQAICCTQKICCDKPLCQLCDVAAESLM